MGAVTEYFREETRGASYFLGHDIVSDFYLSCWQRNRSCIPLLCLRAFLFLGCVGILVASLVLSLDNEAMTIGYWFIYLTHWGLILITVATGCAFTVSLTAYIQGPLEATFKLPWYVKTYWVLYNAAVPIAFLISGFYYLLLTGLEEELEFSVDPVLDIFIHGINSVIMFILLVTSRHPSRPSHVFHPLMFGIVYLIFNVVYYFAGGTDPRGNHWIYPQLDWEEPGETVAVVALTALAIVILHLLVVGIALLRSYLGKQCTKSNTFSVSKGGFD